ncbi:Lsr2 family protein [Arthrobacter sp. ov118]|uniref:histone-like nucleoid-structuring protein Lsr2 n=1 Tax=Arthrobacter sp. ov118 TaxID=1761747 RepID=UPI0008EBFA28|nr:Lsr2 family protein [Arthrobacter sp. ov118]SFU10730.1 Lsr2 protein [Arthrobacter sp. ov118]
MARKIHVQLIDDLSGEDAQETVRFSLDGTDYEIDLSAENSSELREALARFVSHGRRIRSAAAGSRRGRTGSTGREETQKIREWAMANGYSPSSRGRISQDIKNAYDDAHS